MMSLTSSGALPQPTSCPSARRVQHQQLNTALAGYRTRYASALQPQQLQRGTQLPSLQQAVQQHHRQHRRLHRLAVAAAADKQQQEDQQQDLAASLAAQDDDHSDLLGHIDLPPSRSAALWLQELDDEQLQRQASKWGYIQVGRPLPEGLSLTAITDTVPDEHFELDLVKAVGYLAMSLGVMALGYSYLWYWHSICPWWQQFFCWVVIGTGYFGVFQSAVDCAHFAFWPSRPLVQDLLGATLMAPALISYEIWRLKYFNHLM